MADGKVLVIGIGNDLRGDDAAGRRAAEAVEQIVAAGASRADVLQVHQLTPELAAELASCDAAIFLDASADLQQVGIAVRDLHPAGQPDVSSAHNHSPESLLALCRDLYQRLPRAVLISIPARSFDLGEELSAEASEGVRCAVAEVAKILESVRRSR